jgi:hypothetical protein
MFLQIVLQSERSNRLQSDAALIDCQQELDALKHELSALTRDRTPVRTASMRPPLHVRSLAPGCTLHALYAHCASNACMRRVQARSETKSTSKRGLKLLQSQCKPSRTIGPRPPEFARVVTGQPSALIGKAARADPFGLFETGAGSSLPMTEVPSGVSTAPGGVPAGLWATPQPGRRLVQHSAEASERGESPAAARQPRGPSSLSPVRAQPAIRALSPVGSLRTTTTPSRQAESEYSMLSGPRVLKRMQTSPSQPRQPLSPEPPASPLARRSASATRTESAVGSPIRFVPLTTPLKEASKPAPGSYSHLELRQSPHFHFGRDSTIVKDVRKDRIVDALLRSVIRGHHRTKIVRLWRSRKCGML